MATPLVKIIGSGGPDWAFGLNNGSPLTTSPLTGLSEVTEANSESEYTTFVDYVASDGTLADKIFSGQVNKGSMSGIGLVGSTSAVTFANLATSFTDIGGNGKLTATRIAGSNSHEDLSKVSIEGIGAPDINIT